MKNIELIPTMQSPAFSYDVRLDGVLVRVRLNWAETVGRWFLGLFNPDTKEPYISGVKVVPGVPLLIGYRTFLPDGIKGDIVAASPDMEALGKAIELGIGYEDLTRGRIGLYYYSGGE